MMSDRAEGYYHIQIDEGVWECGFWNSRFKSWEFGGLEYKDRSIFRVGPRIPTPDEPWVTVPKEATIDMQRAIRTPDSGGQDHWAARVIKRIVDAAPRP